MDSVRNWERHSGAEVRGVDPRSFGSKRSAKVGVAVGPRGSAVLKEAFSAAAFESQNTESLQTPGERRIPEGGIRGGVGGPRGSSQI